MALHSGLLWLADGFERHDKLAPAPANLCDKSELTGAGDARCSAVSHKLIFSGKNITSTQDKPLKPSDNLQAYAAPRPRSARIVNCKCPRQIRSRTCDRVTTTADPRTGAWTADTHNVEVKGHHTSGRYQELPAHPDLRYFDRHSRCYNNPHCGVPLVSTRPRTACAAGRLSLTQCECCGEVTSMIRYRYAPTGSAMTEMNAGNKTFLYAEKLLNYDSYSGRRRPSSAPGRYTCRQPPNHNYVIRGDIPHFCNFVKPCPVYDKVSGYRVMENTETVLDLLSTYNQPPLLGSHLPTSTFPRHSQSLTKQVYRVYDKAKPNTYSIARNLTTFLPSKPQRNSNIEHPMKYKPVSQQLPKMRAAPHLYGDTQSLQQLRNGLMGDLNAHLLQILQQVIQKPCFDDLAIQERQSQPSKESRESTEFKAITTGPQGDAYSLLNTDRLENSPDGMFFPHTDGPKTDSLESKLLYPVSRKITGNSFADQRVKRVDPIVDVFKIATNHKKHNEQPDTQHISDLPTSVQSFKQGGKQKHVTYEDDMLRNKSLITSPNDNVLFLPAIAAAKPHVNEPHQTYQEESLLLPLLISSTNVKRVSWNSEQEVENDKDESAVPDDKDVIAVEIKVNKTSLPRDVKKQADDESTHESSTVQGSTGRAIDSAAVGREFSQQYANQNPRTSLDSSLASRFKMSYVRQPSLASATVTFIEGVVSESTSEGEVVIAPNSVKRNGSVRRTSSGVILIPGDADSSKQYSSGPKRSLAGRSMAGSSMVTLPHITHSAVKLDTLHQQAIGKLSNHALDRDSVGSDYTLVVEPNTLDSKRKPLGTPIGKFLYPVDSVLSGNSNITGPTPFLGRHSANLFSTPKPTRISNPDTTESAQRPQSSSAAVNSPQLFSSKTPDPIDFSLLNSKHHTGSLLSTSSTLSNQVQNEETFLPAADTYDAMSVSGDTQANTRHGGEDDSRASSISNNSLIQKIHEELFSNMKEKYTAGADDALSSRVTHPTDQPISLDPLADESIDSGGHRTHLHFGGLAVTSSTKHANIIGGQGMIPSHHRNSLASVISPPRSVEDIPSVLDKDSALSERNLNDVLKKIRSERISTVSIGDTRVKKLMSDHRKRPPSQTNIQKKSSHKPKVMSKSSKKKSVEDGSNTMLSTPANTPAVSNEIDFTEPVVVREPPITVMEELQPDAPSQPQPEPEAKADVLPVKPKYSRRVGSGHEEEPLADLDQTAKLTTLMRHHRNSLNAISKRGEQLRLPQSRSPLRMQTWMNGRLALSKRSSRFELPMDMRVLETLTPLEYLTKYCVVTSKRQMLYDKIFLKQKNSQSGKLGYQELQKALSEVLVQSIDKQKMKLVMDMLLVDENVQIDKKLFHGVSAFAERLLYPIFVRGEQYTAETQKEKIETADFFALEWKFHGVNVNQAIRRILETL